MTTQYEELLESLFVKYGTDKGHLGGSGWGYTPYYAQITGPKRFNVRRVLEIGICGHRDIPNNVVGASLFVWRDFFPNAQIFGVDNDQRFIFHDQPRITTQLCNAYNQRSVHDCLVSFGGEPFDLIIDDAVHDPEPQIQLMNQLGNWLIPGGDYFMEDVCPYKAGGSCAEMMDKIEGYSQVVTFATPKPEYLLTAIK
jgi:hypothetical protein